MNTLPLIQLPPLPTERGQSLNQRLSVLRDSALSDLVMIFGVLVALSQVGISLELLLAGLGIAGFIVGFALQDMLGNFATGVGRRMFLIPCNRRFLSTF